MNIFSFSTRFAVVALSTHSQAMPWVMAKTGCTGGDELLSLLSCAGEIQQSRCVSTTDDAAIWGVQFAEGTAIGSVLALSGCPVNSVPIQLWAASASESSGMDGGLPAVPHTVLSSITSSVTGAAQWAVSFITPRSAAPNSALPAIEYEQVGDGNQPQWGPR